MFEVILYITNIDRLKRTVIYYSVIFYILFSKALGFLDCKVSTVVLITDESETIYKEAVMSQWRYYPHIFSENLRKTTESQDILWYASANWCKGSFCLYIRVCIYRKKGTTQWMCLIYAASGYCSSNVKREKRVYKHHSSMPCPRFILHFILEEER